MKCYNHEERSGVAICMACGKALCQECARENTEGISCRHQCSDSLKEKKVLFAELALHLKSLKRANLLSALFSMAMGALFIYFSNLGFGFVYDFVFFLGIGFSAYGIVALFVYIFIFMKHRRIQNSK